MDILYLVHRIPFPPDKGDKIRSFRWLVHMAEKHRVHLVTLYDDPQDLQYVKKLEEYCATVRAFRLSPKKAKLRALAALASTKPLSLPYFAHSGAKRAVKEIVENESIDLAVVFSSSMCQYTDNLKGVPVVLDMVDVDSAKFARYAELGRGPSSKIYAVEAKRLGRYEEQQVKRCDKVVLVTEPEADLLRVRVKDADKVVAIGNGVVPPTSDDIPERRDSDDIVFVGAMDYQPNVDAVIFGANEVMPLVRKKRPNARFIIVGRDPTPEVEALQTLPGVEVTGAVPSIATYLQEAALSLVPLRIAQGIQNKVLEAMAWALPVVTNRRIALSLDSNVDEVLLSAETVEEYADAVIRLLEDRDLAKSIGEKARVFVSDEFSWEPRLREFDGLLDGARNKDVVTS